MKASQVWCAFAGLILGASAGWIMHGESEETTRTFVVERPAPAEPTSAAPDGARVARRSFAESRGTGDGESGSKQVASAPFSDEAELITPALLAYFESEFVRTWTESRGGPPTADEIAAAVANCVEWTLGMARGMGRNGAAEKTKHEAMATLLADADAAALSIKMKEGAWKPSLDDLETGLLSRLTARKTQGPSFDGEGLKEAPAAGTTIRFGVGLYSFDPRVVIERAGKARMPEDLEFVGAGINSTLVVLTSGNSFYTNSDVRGFTVRDMTVSTGGHCGPFELRGPSTAIALERVRIVGYDCGAGGSECFSGGDSTFLRADGCEFLAGFGRNSWIGHCRLGGGSKFTARFDGCRFEGTDLELRNGERTALFKSCTFALAPEDPLKAPAASNIRFVGCTTLSTQDPTKAPEGPPRDLTEWFPQLRK